MTMFLHSKRLFKDGKAYRHFSVVENHRVRSGRVVQRQVFFLGEISDSQHRSTGTGHGPELYL
jgi:hypothetical protein